MLKRKLLGVAVGLMMSLNVLLAFMPVASAASTWVRHDKFDGKVVSASGGVSFSAPDSNTVSPAYNQLKWDERKAADFSSSSELSDVEVVQPCAHPNGHVVLASTNTVEKNIYVPNTFNSIFHTRDCSKNPPADIHYQVVAQTFTAPADGLITTIELPVYKVQLIDQNKNAFDPIYIDGNNQIQPAPLNVHVVPMAPNGPAWSLKNPAGVIASGSELPAKIGTNAGVWMTFMMSSPGSVVKGVEYAIVVWSECDMLLNNINAPCYRWEASVIDNYANGQVWGMNFWVVVNNVPGGWFTLPMIGGNSYDCPFKLTIKSYKASGHLTSKVLDSTSVQNGVSAWGAVLSQVSVPPNTGAETYLRSGNTKSPDLTWSDWVRVKQGGVPALPKNRFVQYKVELSADFAYCTPVFVSFTLTYCQEAGWFESKPISGARSIEWVKVVVSPNNPAGTIQLYIRSWSNQLVGKWISVDLDTKYDFYKQPFGGNSCQYRLELLKDQSTCTTPSVDVVVVEYEMVP